jgi:hypothetical protein
MPLNHSITDITYIGIQRYIIEKSYVQLIPLIVEVVAVRIQYTRDRIVLSTNTKYRTQCSVWRNKRQTVYTEKSYLFYVRQIESVRQ